jgi:hypothetical protein
MVMNSEHSSEQPPAKLGRRSAADRVRSYRHRRRRGLRCIRVQVGRAELDGLVAEGYVLRGDGDNIARIALAINDRNFIGSMVRSPRLLGPVAANSHSRRRGRLPFTSS